MAYCRLEASVIEMEDNPTIALNWRSIGPTRGGRVAAVSGDPMDPATFYFGSSGGGVWKSTNAGQTWKNVSDGYFARSSVGAIAVAPSDPEVVYVGMGESTLRNNISHGDGVYKTVDGGRNWVHLGLEQTRHIGKIRIDPQDSNRVFVAAFGHAHGPNDERGVYRSLDGGETWELVLTRGPQAGAIDLSMDPINPKIIFAAFWEAERGPHYMKSGGPGSGLWRSTDGGDSWEDLSEKPGMPEGIKGKVGVSLSPAQPGRVWCLIEHENGGVFRSDDGGDVWTRVNADGALTQRAWYFTHIQADSQDPDSVWVLNLDCWRSLDGGVTFEFVSVPHEDSHDLWFDPNNNRRIILGCDGGGTISLNGGDDWSTIYNQPTAEFYKVAVDRSFNYRVYGSQQDNSSISIPSRSDHEAITTTEWEIEAGGEAGWMAVHPQEPGVSYGGITGTSMTRYDRKTGQVRDISIWPYAVAGKDAKDVRYRFNWTAPLILSAHDPNIVIAAGNQVFRSSTEGASWEVISPDLTRADPETLTSLNPSTAGERGTAETYGTIYALSESPRLAGVIWTGSDDGRVHVTRDNGQSWVDVTPDTLPDWTQIVTIDASPHDPATAYLAATRYKLDDFQPFVYRTTDYGEHWEQINGDLPGDTLTRVVREDPIAPGLLYLGTETGAFVSIDGGGTWRRLGRNLPIVPVHDLHIHGTDLVAGTHGRGFWILDDVTPLHELRMNSSISNVHLFTPRDSYRLSHIPRLNISPKAPKYVEAAGLMVTLDDDFEHFLDAGHNPPAGVIVRYQLPSDSARMVRLSFHTGDGQEVFSFKEKDLPTAGGINTVMWDLTVPNLPAHGNGPDDASDLPTSHPPRVLPGAYTVRLGVGDETFSQTFEVLPDPRHHVSLSDLEAQYHMLSAIRETLVHAQETVRAVGELRTQLVAFNSQVVSSDIRARMKARISELIDQLASVEGELVQVRARPGTIWDTLKWPTKLTNELISLSSVVGSGDYRPTQQSVELYEELADRVARQRQEFVAVVERTKRLNDDLLRHESAMISIPERLASLS